MQRYEAAQRWLYSLITDPEGKRFERDKSAETVRQELRAAIPRLLDFLQFAGNPHQKFRSIHVAGTSGKGSVTTMIAALLTACGFDTVDHTSPFLQVPTEKLRRNGEIVSAEQFADLVWQFRDLYEAWGKRLAYIEAWTALTMLWMAHVQPDFAVYETGMGGRFDPSNVLASELAVITNVDFDHMKSLGDSLHEIAWHKAGIIESNGRVVTAARKRDVLAEIARESAEKNAKLQHVNFQTDGDTLTVCGRFATYSVRVANAGGFQGVNAATAITAVDWLAHDFGFELSDHLIEETLRGVRTIGRLETMQTDPLIIIDGAHNPHKATALAQAVRSAYPERPITVLMGMVGNKASVGVVEALLPVAARFIFSEPNVFGKPALPATQLVETLRKLSADTPYTIAPNVQDGIERWLSEASADEMLLVTGSIYMIGEARGRWFPIEELLQIP